MYPTLQHNQHDQPRPHWTGNSNPHHHYHTNLTHLPGLSVRRYDLHSQIRQNDLNDRFNLSRALNLIHDQFDPILALLMEKTNTIDTLVLRIHTLEATLSQLLHGNIHTQTTQNPPTPELQSEQAPSPISLTNPTYLTHQHPTSSTSVIKIEPKN